MVAMASRESQEVGLEPDPTTCLALLGVGALAGDVTSLTTAVARLLLLGVGALARKMALATAVVAGGVTLSGAVAGLVGDVAAYGEECQSMLLQ